MSSFDSGLNGFLKASNMLMTLFLAVIFKDKFIDLILKQYFQNLVKDHQSIK